jgi:hypothetical protein
MSTGSIVILSAVVFVFLLYGAVLMWADGYSRDSR